MLLAVLFGFGKLSNVGLQVERVKLPSKISLGIFDLAITSGGCDISLAHLPHRATGPQKPALASGARERARSVQFLSPRLLSQGITPVSSIYLSSSTLCKLRLGLGGTGQNDRTNSHEGDRLGLVRVTEGNPK